LQICPFKIASIVYNSPETQREVEEFLSADNSFTEDPTLNMVVEERVEAIKISEFWTHNPVGWFLQLEAQFGIRTTPVPAKTQFFHVISNLPSNILELCTAVTSVPPTDNSFAAIKKLLLKKYQKSDLDKGFQLLKFTTRGELTPSESLAKVERMWSYDFKKAVWLRTLEPELRTLLTGDKSSTLLQLADKADEILEQTSACKDDPVATVAAVAAPASAQSKPRTNNRRKDYSNEPIVDSTGMCYMHRKWGTKAFTCRGPPCIMVGQTATKPPPAGN
jgi:hypothetical protein